MKKIKKILSYFKWPLTSESNSCILKLKSGGRFRVTALNGTKYHPATVFRVQRLVRIKRKK